MIDRRMIIKRKVATRPPRIYRIHRRGLETRMIQAPFLEVSVIVYGSVQDLVK